MRTKDERKCMTDTEKFEEWLNAKFKRPPEIPPEIDELTYLHLWVKYGIEHDYFFIQIQCCSQQKGDNHMNEQNTEIKYSDCADALLKLWIEDIITDGEYNRIMDRLNKAYKDGVFC